MIDVQVLEQVARVQPLGLRFWDRVTESIVGDGLLVTAYPAAYPARRTEAFTNRSGVYSFRDLPGLREIESGAGDAAFWAAHPPQFDFVVEVIDAAGRYLPFQLPVKLPVRDVYAFPDFAASPPAGLQSFIPLYSAPARPIASPMAILRAELYDPIRKTPAAWAVVEAQTGDAEPVRGIADNRGRVLLPFPFPEPQSFGLGSPLRPGGIKLAEQEWPVQLKFAYTQRTPAPAIPDLAEILNQLPAPAWEDSSLSTPLTGTTLHFGQDVVLRSRGAAPVSTVMSVLLITAAGPSPK
ncbi:MAG TPA: hypothetical protein VIX89_11285 [Bryobacteraceae bacterium]